MWVVPLNISHAEANAWRRAAQRLARKGQVKAVYKRRPDRRGRLVRHLAVALPQSDAEGDVLPLRAPAWVEPPPPFLCTFGVRLQAHLLEHVAGVPVSASSASRRMREWCREQPQPKVVFVA